MLFAGLLGTSFLAFVAAGRGRDGTTNVVLDPTV